MKAISRNLSCVLLFLAGFGLWCWLLYHAGALVDSMPNKWLVVGVTLSVLSLSCLVIGKLTQVCFDLSTLRRKVEPQPMKGSDRLLWVIDYQSQCLDALSKYWHAHDWHGVFDYEPFLVHLRAAETALAHVMNGRTLLCNRSLVDLSDAKLTFDVSPLGGRVKLLQAYPLGSEPKLRLELIPLDVPTCFAQRDLYMFSLSEQLTILQAICSSMRQELVKWQTQQTKEGDKA